MRMKNKFYAELFIRSQSIFCGLMCVRGFYRDNRAMTINRVINGYVNILAR